MLNTKMWRRIGLTLAAWVIYGLFLICSPTFAQTTVDPPLTISGIVVDKTDKNAVLARTAAMAEAKRQAFRQLAERRLGADKAKSLVLPEDRILAGLIQDFEITAEQLAAKRYVGTFTVRFRPEVSSYVGADSVNDTQGPRTILILPYLDTDNGRLLLWEDENVWLKTWQSTAPTPPGLTLALPMGDIEDVATGSSEGVWSGSYTAIEALMKKYNAVEAILTAASWSPDTMSIDLYRYTKGQFVRLSSITPVIVGKSQSSAFTQAVGEVVNALQKIPPMVAESPSVPIAASQEDDRTTPTATNLSGSTVITADIFFDSAAMWLDVQKRVAAITPPVYLEVQTISNEGARIVLRHEGSPSALQGLLHDQGLVLEAATDENPVKSYHLILPH